MAPCNYFFLFVYQQRYFGFWKKGRVILKKGGFKPALANHTKGNFGLSRAFLSQIQQLVRRLVNQISSYTMGTHQSFLIYEQVTFMLYYRIHELQISKASKLFGFWGQMENYCCHYQQQWQNFLLGRQHLHLRHFYSDLSLRVMVSFETRSVVYKRVWFASRSKSTSIDFT